MKKRIDTLSSVLSSFDVKKTAVVELKEEKQIDNSSLNKKDSPVFNVPPSRIGKKAITGFFEEEVVFQLKQLALEKRTTIQNLLKQSLNDLFIKYNKPPVA